MHQAESIKPPSGPASGVTERTLVAQMAHHLIDSGVAPVPTRNKIPTENGWQKRRITHGEVDQKFKNGTSIGVVCGDISGGLEILDFDCGGEQFDLWRKEVERRSMGLYEKLLVEKTPSGGFHVIYKVSGVRIVGNLKLSRKRIVVPSEGEHEYQGKGHKAVRDGKEWVIRPVAIETRGTGGQAVIWPSPGYVVVQNDGKPVLTMLVSDWKLPKISADDQKVLLDCARMFDEPLRSEAIRTEKTSRLLSGDIRPGDDYNDRATPDQGLAVLQAAGWKIYRKIGATLYLTRPGKENGVSGALYTSSVFHCFTSNGHPFDEGKSYSPFALIALLSFNGDFGKAAAALRKEGYGASDNVFAEAPKNLQELCARVLETREAAGDFDLGCLPRVLREYVGGIARTTAADPIMIAQSVLCAAAGVLGKHVYIGTDTYFQNLYPNIYTLTISQSGSFKSTAQNKGMRLAYELNKQFGDEAKALLMSTIGAGLSDEEMEKVKVKIANCERQQPLLPSKTTPEALLQTLGAGCGGVITVSEFGEWMANMTKGHNADFKGLITDFYDCPVYYRYKTKNNGDFIVERPFISINAVSTLRWVAQHVTAADIEAGFFARFLIFCPPRRFEIPPALPAPALRPDNSSYQAFKDCLLTVHEVREYYLPQDARAAFEEIHKFLFSQYASGSQSDLLEPFVKRWGAYVLKLGIIMQIMIDPATNLIGSDAIRSAFSVVEYAIKSTLHLFREHFELPETARTEQKVLDYIAKQGGKVVRHKLQSSRLLDGNSKTYDDVVTSLIDQGRVSQTRGKSKRDDQYCLTEC